MLKVVFAQYFLKTNLHLSPSIAPRAMSSTFLKASTVRPLFRNPYCKSQSAHLVFAHAKCFQCSVWGAIQSRRFAISEPSAYGEQLLISNSWYRICHPQLPGYNCIWSTNMKIILAVSMPQFSDIPHYMLFRTDRNMPPAIPAKSASKFVPQCDISDLIVFPSMALSHTLSPSSLLRQAAGSCRIL